MNMRFVDLHCDTLLEMYSKNRDLAELDGHIDLAALRQGGALMQCFAAFLPTYDCAQRHGVTLPPYELFHAMADVFDRQMEKYKDEIAPARCYGDVQKNAAAGKISAMLTVEDAVLLDGKIERVDELYARGVRMTALTWNYENSLGFPNSPDGALHAKGLKPFGIAAVERMNELGMIVDVSHLSEGGFWDVSRYSKRPFAASHSCARALCDHSRNLTDAQLKALGDAGGVCGVNFYSAFLNGREDYTPNADIVRHMQYIKDKAGIAAVALGSDFDGIDCALEMGGYAGMPSLAEAMSGAFTDDEIDLICGINALRLLREAVG